MAQQTAVDLPDPLESKGDNALANADDLLAQLAGEEVDRLLAEADGVTLPPVEHVEIPPAAASEPVEAAPPVAAATAAAAPAPGADPAAAAAPVAKDETGAAMEELFNQLTAATSENPLPPPGKAEVAEAVAADEATVDGLLTEINHALSSDAAPTALPAPAPAAAPVPEATPAPAPAVESATTVMPSTSEAIGLEILDPPAPADAAAAAANAAQATPAATVEETLAQRAQELIEQAKQQDAAPAAAAAPAAQPASAADALAAEMAADEKAHAAAMRRMSGAPAATGASAADLAVIDEAAVEHAAQLEAAETAAQSELDGGRRASLLVRLLEWLNAPLSSLSEELREALGKVALVTMFNSVAVLLYVMIFRRH
jgi:hypothetical protein